MNARHHPEAISIAKINRQTESVKEAHAAILAMGPWPMPLTEFNDDDIYVYNAVSKVLVRQIACKDQEAKDAQYIGVKVMAGQSWAKGMTAKSLNIWRPDCKATASTTDAGVVG